MPCDTLYRRNQTLTQRKTEVKKVVEKFNAGLASKSVRAVVGKNGAITFTGLSDSERDGVTDACVYRQIMVSGTALAKQAIHSAELRAGRSVDKSVLATGTHSHDGGQSWDAGHK